MIRLTVTDDKEKHVPPVNLSSDGVDTTFHFSFDCAQELHNLLARALHPNTGGSLSTKIWKTLDEHYAEFLKADPQNRAKQHGIIVGMAHALAILHGIEPTAVIQKLMERHSG